MIATHYVQKSCWVLVVLSLSACASTSPVAHPEDPYEAINRKIYTFNEGFDRYTLKPLAQGYQTVMPQVGKVLVNNFFSNLDDVGVTINDFLQLKVKQGFSDGSRVLFNTTFGIGGLINVTSRLPKHDEDFGQTLGYWGVKPGPYIMLPFFGPKSVRDTAGFTVDGYTGVITNITNVPLRNTLYFSDKINNREHLLKDENVLEEVEDRYSFIRNIYLKNRENLVYDGNPPADADNYKDEED